MDEFNDHRQLDVIPTAVAGSTGTEHVEQGSQAFTTPMDDVMTNLIDEDHIRGQSPANQLINRGSIRLAEGQHIVKGLGARGCGHIIHGQALYEPNSHGKTRILPAGVDLLLC
jgi:hypothetical protein